MRVTLVMPREVLDAASGLIAALQEYDEADPADQAAEQEVVDASNKITLLIQSELGAKAPEPSVQKRSVKGRLPSA
ncbi:hypothetical protein GCM10009610_65890 [Pseudonocardia xinjiangensis]